ncbi:MAG: hypothetical protein ACXIU2_06945, partial [Cyclobacteriaceae bacterium]
FSATNIQNRLGVLFLIASRMAGLLISFEGITLLSIISIHWDAFSSQVLKISFSSLILRYVLSPVSVVFGRY